LAEKDRQKERLNSLLTVAMPWLKPYLQVEKTPIYNLKKETELSQPGQKHKGRKRQSNARRIEKPATGRDADQQPFSEGVVSEEDPENNLLHEGVEFIPGIYLRRKNIEGGDKTARAVVSSSSLGPERCTKEGTALSRFPTWDHLFQRS